MHNETRQSAGPPLSYSSCLFLLSFLQPEAEMMNKTWHDFYFLFFLFCIHFLLFYFHSLVTSFLAVPLFLTIKSTNQPASQPALPTNQPSNQPTYQIALWNWDANWDIKKSKTNALLHRQHSVRLNVERPPILVSLSLTPTNPNQPQTPPTIKRREAFKDVTVGQNRQTRSQSASQEYESEPYRRTEGSEKKRKKQSAEIVNLTFRNLHISYKHTEYPTCLPYSAADLRLAAHNDLPDIKYPSIKSHQKSTQW